MPWIEGITPALATDPLLEWRVNVVDVAALVTAVFAIVIAIGEMRRNGSVVLSVEEATFSGRQDIKVNAGEFYRELRILVRNNGVALHNIRACLEFAEELPHTAWHRLPLDVNKDIYGEGPFSKGMLAEFRWLSYELDCGSIQTLTLLRDCKKQRAVLRVYSQRYLAYTRPTTGVLPRAFAYCNKWIQLANIKSLRRVGKNSEGHDVVDSLVRFPTFVNVEGALMMFVESLKRPQ
ncbi:MAG: hypothetical protein WCJ31_09755 [Planctomycetia bacterium]